MEYSLGDELQVLACKVISINPARHFKTKEVLKTDC